MKQRWALSILCLGAVVLSVSAGVQESSGRPYRTDRLKRRVEGVIAGLEAGIVGVAAKHLETGEELLIEGDTPFPMASTFKLPVLVEVLARVEEGEFDLDDMIEIKATDQHFGSGLISDLDVPGVSLSIRNLVYMMMTVSDNSAADLLLTMVGADRVTGRLRSLGIEDLSVDRTCHELIMDAMGVNPENYVGLTLEEATKAYRAELRDNPGAYEEAAKNFSRVMKDQSTPWAMNRLLELVFCRRILTPERCDHIIEVMTECQTGANRIKGLLPGRTRVAHKTGTISGTVNDVGVIFLPGDLGRVALTVLSKDSVDDTAEIEEIIARIARLVYDYFYFTVPEQTGSFSCSVAAPEDDEFHGMK